MSESIKAASFTNLKNFLQDTHSVAELLARSYSITADEKNFTLVPFSRIDLDSEALHTLLANWREKHIYA